MKIISVSGLISSGKDTIGTYLVENYQFKKVSFAGTLKDAVSVIFGWDRVMLEGASAGAREEREKIDPWWSKRLDNPKLSPRWVLQYFGTETCRRHFHNDIWLASLENVIRKNETDRIVVTDARFMNEVTTLKGLGASMIRVKRGPDPDWFEQAKTEEGYKTVSLRSDIHPSEYDWARFTFDHTIENNSTLAELYSKVNRGLDLR